MSSPAENWCPDCSAVCNDHGTVCTICGSSLTSPPAPLQQRDRSRPQRLFPALPNRSRPQRLFPALPNRLRVPVELEFVWSDLNGMQLLTNNLDELQPLGVPQDILDGLPRERLTRQSSILKESTLTLLTAISGEGIKKTVLQVIPAEFGAIQADVQNVRLVTRENTTHLDDIDNVTSSDVQGTILVLRRGQTSFAHKARSAQKLGVLGLVIVNDRAAPWPYVMIDSTNNEAKDIVIPVVMVPQGTPFPKKEDYSNNNNNNNPVTIRASLKIQENADLTCCVCTESFCNTTVIQLPKCHHRFHEACALAWLSNHNSCPYCRSIVHATGSTGVSHHDMPDVGDAFYG